MLAAALTTVAFLPWNTSSASTDEGVIHTGVGSEEEARAFPCPPGDSGPVVCVPDRDTSWQLTSDASGECSQGLAGWYGDCVRAFDAGDHLRVWGTRGIAPTDFRITWQPPPERSTGTATRSTTSGDGDVTGGSAQTADAGSARERDPGDVATPRVAPPAGSSTTSAAPAPVDPSAGPNAMRTRREVPEAAFWDPPASEVPGYSDLLALPRPTYPGVPAELDRGRDGSPAPAAAAGIALLACGWVWWEQRRRAEPGTALG